MCCGFGVEAFEICQAKTPRLKAVVIFVICGRQCVIIFFIMYNFFFSLIMCVILRRSGLAREQSFLLTFLFIFYFFVGSLLGGPFLYLVGLKWENSWETLVHASKIYTIPENLTEFRSVFLLEK